MVRTFVNTRVFVDPSWWHWAITVPLLGTHLLGVPWTIEAALALCGAMTVYYLLRFRSVQPFPVQVRLAFLVWLLVGLLPAMQWLHFIAFVGTTARISIGYCLLGRLLGLAWFNRTEPLTLGLLHRQLLTPPSGALFHWRPPPEMASANSCSLQLGGPAGIAALAGCTTLKSCSSDGDCLGPGE